MISLYQSMTAFDGMLSLKGFLREFIIIIIATRCKFTQKPRVVLVNWSSMYLGFTCTADTAYRHMDLCIVIFRRPSLHIGQID